MKPIKLIRGYIREARAQTSVLGLSLTIQVEGKGIQVEGKGPVTGMSQENWNRAGTLLWLPDPKRSPKKGEAMNHVIGPLTLALLGVLLWALWRTWTAPRRQRGTEGRMSDPNYAHQFEPSRRGKCKRIIGAEICGLPEGAAVHQRYSHQYEEREGRAMSTTTKDERDELLRVMMLPGTSWWMGDVVSRLLDERDELEKELDDVRRSLTFFHANAPSLPIVMNVDNLVANLSALGGELQVSERERGFLGEARTFWQESSMKAQRERYEMLLRAEKAEAEVATLRAEVERLKEDIVTLKNVLRSDEAQQVQWQKRNLEMQNDCIATAKARDLTCTEVERLTADFAAFRETALELDVDRHQKIADLAAAKEREESLTEALNAFAESDCEYGDGCPRTATRHGQCWPCRADAALAPAQPEELEDTDPCDEPPKTLLCQVECDLEPCGALSAERKAYARGLRTLAVALHHGARVQSEAAHFGSTVEQAEGRGAAEALRWTARAAARRARQVEKGGTKNG